ncbi:MAG: type II and III secretion system protein family protein [Alphaproteobacteria bacterium]|nr:type II and III secretion system protein family protein [Alphaproteobacteria bacterium]
MNRLIAIVMLLCGLVASTAASAQSAHVGKVLTPAPKAIELALGHGQLISLPRAANAVFVGDSSIADVSVRSPRLVYVFAKGVGETTVYAVDDRDQLVIGQRINVAANLDRVRELFRKLRPNSNVEIMSVGHHYVLTGTVETAEIADEFLLIAQGALSTNSTRPDFAQTNFINRITVVAPNQVNIRVKIAEVSRDINKRIGFNWEVMGRATADWMLGFAVGSDIVRNAAGGIIVPADGQDRIASLYNGESVTVDTILDLMDDEGLITILAEPNLTAMSGETASFLAGGEFPIPIAQEEGKTTIEFKQFGVSLAFTPTILSRNRINLKIRPEVSQLNSAGSIQANGFNIPSLTTRRADTTVELGSGQSFAIAGLLQNTTNQNLSDVPGIKEIPVLGALFRSDAFRRQESELMIVVTPYIVRPTSGRMPLPTDNYLPPKDYERFLLGQTHVAQPAAKKSAPLDPTGRPGIAGPAGFLLQ